MICRTIIAALALGAVLTLGTHTSTGSGLEPPAAPSQPLGVR